MISATEALERLRDGNRRFVSDTGRPRPLTNHRRRSELVPGQEPFAIVLGCSDSRVPAELVFDLGLGDMFVIRVAGNIVAPSQIGSVEFAAHRFGTRLVVVLGHSTCGAVLATLDELRRPTESRQGNIRSIVDRIKPSVEGLLETEGADDPKILEKHVNCGTGPKSWSIWSETIDCSLSVLSIHSIPESLTSSTMARRRADKNLGFSASQVTLPSEGFALTQLTQTAGIPASDTLAHNTIDG